MNLFDLLNCVETLVFVGILILAILATIRILFK